MLGRTDAGVNFLLKGAICSGLPSVGRHLGGDVPTSPGWVTDSAFGLTQLCHLGCPASWEETLPQVHSHISLPGLCSGVPGGPLVSTRPLPLLPGRQTGMWTLSDQRNQGKGESREAGKETKGRSKSARKDGGEACRGSWLKKKKGQTDEGREERTTGKEGREKKKKRKKNKA